jgi:hypothetical protein
MAETLTLSFTVAAAFSARLPHDRVVLHLAVLVWAWRLLVLSMLGCLYHNAVAVNATPHGKMFERLTSAKANLRLMQVAAGRPDASSDADEALDDQRKRLRRALRHCGFSYKVAHVATFVALCLLLWFVTANARMAFSTSVK